MSAHTRIGPIGTAARLLVGLGCIVAAVVIGIEWFDLLVGVVGASLVVIALQWLRGRNAPPVHTPNEEEESVVLYDADRAA